VTVADSISLPVGACLGEIYVLWGVFAASLLSG